MEIKFLHSGSGGNCFVIITDSVTVAVDIGLNKTQTEKKLIEAGVMPDSIDAIFLTHGHKDHCNGLPMAKKWNIPVYASAGTWKTVNFDGMANVIGENGWYMGDVHVTYFKTHHDDYDALGYVITTPSEKISVCLDTGHVSPDMIEAMNDSTHYIIEANHDVDMTIMDQSRPDNVKARNLSDLGHLSNDQTAEALCKLIQGKGEQIYLVHLSGANNRPTIAMATVMRALKGKGLKINKDYFMGVH